MKSKILGGNLILLIVYSGLVALFTKPQHHYELAIAIPLAVLLGIHAIFNLIAALVLFSQKEEKEAQLCLLSVLLIVLIGFSFCHTIIELQ